jgi:hypothetical protein
MADTVLVHPNRDKPESKATRAVVILLLVTSAALILIVTIGGWSELQGMEIVSIGYAILYLVMAYFVGKWNRGVLPVARGPRDPVRGGRGRGRPGLVRPRQGRLQ